MCCFTQNAWFRRANLPVVCASSTGLGGSQESHQGYPQQRVQHIICSGNPSHFTDTVVQVSSVATEVFYESEGFQPIVDFSKLIYSLELLLRLGWRVGKPGSTSCFVIARTTHCSYSHKVCTSAVPVLINSMLRRLNQPCC